MGKTVSLPPVRVEPKLLDEMQQISGETGESVYELTRQAVAEFVRRYGRRREQAATLVQDDDGPGLLMEWD